MSMRGWGSTTFLSGAAPIGYQKRGQCLLESVHRSFLACPWHAQWPRGRFMGDRRRLDQCLPNACVGEDSLTPHFEAPSMMDSRLKS